MNRMPADHLRHVRKLLGTLSSDVGSTDWNTQLEDAEDRGQLDAGTAAALRALRSRIEEATRREGLLRLLHETSVDLIGIRDVESILKAIVRRTRTLIGSDIAYLSLNDHDRDESYIRVTDGAATAQFRNIRIPLGGGVLGAVAAGNAPSQSTDYPNDTTKTHFPDSDAAVIAEGVKAIMGVPLWAAGRLIGALMVADRRAHEFSSDDVSLMESIGVHAAVALENARLFSEMTRTLQKLGDAQQENARHTQALESLATMDRNLMESLTASDVLPRLEELVTSFLQADVWILDAAGDSVGSAPTPLHARDAAAVDAVRRSRVTNTPIGYEIAGEDYTAMAAAAGDQHLGVLIVACRADEGHLAVLERAGLVLTATLLFERSLLDAQYRLHRELIDELLAPRSEITDATRERALRYGIVDGAPLVVRVVSAPGDIRSRVLSALRAKRAGSSGVVAVHGGLVCVVEPVGGGMRDRAGTDAVEALALDGIIANVGSSTAVRSLSELPAAFKEGQAVIQALAALERSGEAADIAALGTAGMLLSAMDSQFTANLLESQIGPVLAYDGRRDTQLAETAWVYLDSDASRPAAARRLHIHPNTLRQRVDRIDSILGGDWRKGGRALDVQIALRIWRMRSRGVGGAPPL